MMQLQPSLAKPDDTRALMSIPPALSDMVAQLARSWLSAGATSFAIHGDGVAPARWASESADRGVEPHGCAPLIALIPNEGSLPAGELRVTGMVGPVALGRLESDARLVGGILGLEDEMQRMTAELIEQQDQILALYALAESTRHQLDLVGTLDALAREAARLGKARVGFAIAAVGVETIGVCHPQSALAPHEMEGLLSQARSAGRGLLIREDGTGALPVGATGALLMPMRIRGDERAVLGLLDRHEGGFAAPDLKLMRAVAAQSAMQIEKVLSYQEALAQVKLRTELEVAARIQSRLLPQQLPAVPGLEVCARASLALQVGGDFYDVLPLASGSCMFAIGDVAGKGMPAALLMTVTRTILRNAAKFTAAPAPEALMQRLSQDLYDDLTDVDLFVTAFVGQYYAELAEFRYANAGHSPVIYRPRGCPARLLEADGPALGVLPGSFSRQHTMVLGPGDLLVLGTDGFPEARDPFGELFGYERMVALVERLAPLPAGAITDAIFEEVRAFSAGHEQDDDLTLMVLKGVGE